MKFRIIFLLIKKFSKIKKTFVEEGGHIMLKNLVQCTAYQSRESHVKLAWQALALRCSKVFQTQVPICFLLLSQRNKSGLKSCEKYLKIDYFYSFFADLFLIYIHCHKRSVFTSRYLLQ